MIIVFGSISMDMHIALPRLPQPGETVVCPGYEMRPGGKGANQALAALRMGPKTALIGCVGNDGVGTRLANGLRRQGVTTSGVVHSDMLPTGFAVISFDKRGENQVVVAAGANAAAAAEQVPDEILKPGVWVLAQMEIRPEETWALLSRAHERGAKTVLNLAPALLVPEDVMGKIDYLIMNEIESSQAASLLLPGADVPGPAATARALADRYGLTCLVTLAEKGALAALPGGGNIRMPALPIEPVVDTAGAGDAFCGTLIAALHDGKPLAEAMKYAVVAGSLSCTAEGTQESYPYLGDIEENLPRLPSA